MVSTSQGQITGKYIFTKLCLKLRKSMLLIPFSPCRRYTDQNFILSSAPLLDVVTGDLFYSLILDVLKSQNGKKKVFQLCQSA